MLVIRLWNYFRGYVIIKVEGLTLEKFINLAIAKNIYLWDIIRVDYTTLEAKVSIKGFKALKEVLRKVGCRVTIVRKKGYPFLIHRFKYRKMLAFGAVVALGLILFLTSFIWKIDIVSKEPINEKAIISYLENMEVKAGIRKNKVDLEDIKKSLLKDLDELSYVNADIVGTKLIIEVKKRDRIPRIVKKDTPCNIVAGEKAVIEKITALNGKAVVEKGDIVKKGQILITGAIQDERMEQPLLVHSEGKVLGRTNYTKIIEEPIIQTIKEETGKKYIIKETKIGDKRIQFASGDIPFEHYIEKVTHRKVVKTSFVDIPLEVIEHDYREVRIKKVTRNIDALKKISSVKGIQSLMKEIPSNSKVMSKDVTYSREDNTLKTKIVIEVIQEIGQKEPIQQQQMPKVEEE